MLEELINNGIITPQYMKALVILLVLVGLATMSYFITDVFAICLGNQDWPDAPCFSGKRGDNPSLIQMKQEWAPYYDFKGKDWMESKKQELMTAIENERLQEWKTKDSTGGHANVYTYYFLMGHVPNEDGLFVRESYGVKYLPPLQQKKSGIGLNEIQCGRDLVLIQKYDGMPACVTESTKQKLIERGWTKEAIETEPKIPTRYEKYLDDNNELNFALRYDKDGVIIDDLQRIYDWCDYSGDKPDWYFSWNNQTHHIDSKQCKWHVCDNGEIYHRGVCMTPEAKEKAQSDGKLENEN